MDIITYETIRNAHRAEKDDKLQVLPTGFFKSVRNWLQNKEIQNDSNSLMELENAKRLLEDLINRRQRKLIISALHTVRGDLPPENLNEEEKVFFDKTVILLREFKEGIKEKVFSYDSVVEEKIEEVKEVLEELKTPVHEISKTPELAPQGTQAAAGKVSLTEKPVEVAVTDKVTKYSEPQPQESQAAADNEMTSPNVNVITEPEVMVKETPSAETVVVKELSKPLKTSLPEQKEIPIVQKPVEVSVTEKPIEVAVSKTLEDTSVSPKTPMQPKVSFSPSGEITVGDTFSKKLHQKGGGDAEVSKPVVSKNSGLQPQESQVPTTNVSAGVSAENVNVTSDKPLNNLKRVKVLNDVPKFVGMDLNHYGPYSKDQVVDIPDQVFDLLTKRSLVEMVN